MPFIFSRPVVQLSEMMAILLRPAGDGATAEF